MKHLLGLLAASCICCSADERLHQLAQYDKHTCAELLQSVDVSTLWECFIKGQTELYFDHEMKLLENEEGWINAKNVLEIGSRNGYFLYRVSKAFQDKVYVGIEIDPSLVEQSNANYAHSMLEFEQGDAELEIEAYRDKFDLIIFNLALQRLKDPKTALESAYSYLKEGGHLIIIESYDNARRSSHEIVSVIQAIEQLNSQKYSNNCNRKCSLEILNALQQKESSLAQLYEVGRSSLDENGNRVEEGICFKDALDRKRLFNHGLLFLGILNRRHAIPVDYLSAYDELQVYLNDETSWVSPGVHLLVLKKK